MNIKNYIRYLKYKLELNKARKNYIKTKEDFNEYFFGDKVLEVNEKYKDLLSSKKILKCKDQLYKKALISSVALVGSVGLLIGCNALINNNTINLPDTSLEQSETYSESELSAMNYQLSEDQVLDIAENALMRIENNLVSNGAGTMGEKGTPFYPEWFNSKMITAISFMESSYRVKNQDGTPLYGEEVVGLDGNKERARGMCQILPSTLEYINWWLSSVMESDLRYTMEDCDNPEKAVEICILINIANCKNFFDSNEQIYDDLNFKDNVGLQGKCVVASYKYGAGNVDYSYQKNTLYDTYLNPEWQDGEGANYLKRFFEIYSSIDNNLSLD